MSQLAGLGSFPGSNKDKVHVQSVVLSFVVRRLYMLKSAVVKVTVQIN